MLMTVESRKVLDSIIRDEKSGVSHFVARRDKLYVHTKGNLTKEQEGNLLEKLTTGKRNVEGRNIFLRGAMEIVILPAGDTYYNDRESYINEKTLDDNTGEIS